MQNLVDNELDYDLAFESVQKRIDERRKELERRRQRPDPPSTRFGRALDLCRRYHIVATIIITIVVACLPLLSLFKKPSDPKATVLALEGSPAEVTGSTAAPVGAIQEARERNDPLKELILRIQRGQFERPEDVAAGNFLRNFSVLGHAVEDLDVSRLEVLRRGVGWAEVIGPFKTSEDSSQKQSPRTQTFDLRFVKINTWKLEDLQILSLKQDDKRARR